MKISFMTHACPDWSLDEVIKIAVRLGYHGIEFRIDAKNKHGVEVTATAQERAVIRQKMAAAGLEACCISTSLFVHQEQSLQDTLPRIQLAADIGCPGLRVFCGAIPQTMSVAQAIELCGKHLRQLAPIAAKAGVGLWLETHDTFCKAADAVAAVRLANHPAVGINSDLLHSYRMGEPLETTFALCKGLIRHAHFHDATGPDMLTILPFGKGTTPLDAMIQGLHKLGYDGYISGEFFVNNFDPSSERSIEIYRDDIVGLLKRNNIPIAKIKTSCCV